MTPQVPLEDPQPLDSGYASCASLASTPEKTDDGNSRGTVQSPAALPLHAPSKAFTFGTFKGLKKFEKPVDQAVLDRFKDVVERIEGPLIQYLRKRYREFRPMAIRLMVLGETYEEAKPRVVVLCPEAVSKRVKKFFGQSMIKLICSPNDSSQIPFEVAIIGQPPRPKNTTSMLDVYGPEDDVEGSEWNSPSTLIRLSNNGSERFATMGGLIKITRANHDFVLCGLTAGHVIEEDADICSNDIKACEAAVEDESDMSTDEEIDEDVDMPDAAENRTSHRLDTLEKSDAMSRSAERSWTRIGTISTGSRPGVALDRDWALIENIAKKFQHPNTVQKRGTSPCPCRPLVVPQAEVALDKHQSSVLVLNKETPRRGILSCLPTVALLPSGNKFVPVYTLSLAGGEELPAGTSGSWVINEHSCEVYGHLVADDAFGDVFVVPLSDTMDDIKQTMNAVAVTLPSSIDVLSTISQSNPKYCDDEDGTPRQTETTLTPESISREPPTGTSCATHATSLHPTISQSITLPPPPYSTNKTVPFSSSTGSIELGGLMTPRPSPPNNAGMSSISGPSPAVSSRTLFPDRHPTPPNGPDSGPTGRSSLSPKLHLTVLGNRVADYFRSSSPLNDLFNPFGGHLSSQTGPTFAARRPNVAHLGNFELPPPKTYYPSTTNSQESGSTQSTGSKFSMTSNASAQSGPAGGQNEGMKPAQSPHPYGRPYSFLPPPAPVFSNVGNPNGQLALVAGIPHGMMPGFNSGHAAAMPHFLGHSPQQPAGQDRPFKCDQCPQSFNRNHDLKRHKRIHLAVKPFPCAHCDKSFSRKDALKRHVLVKGCGKADINEEPVLKSDIEEKVGSGAASSTQNPDAVMVSSPIAATSTHSPHAVVVPNPIAASYTYSPNAVAVPNLIPASSIYSPNAVVAPNPIAASPTRSPNAVTVPNPISTSSTHNPDAVMLSGQIAVSH